MNTHTPSDPAEFPLSAGQEQMWFLEQLLPDTSRYCVPQIYRVRGTLRFDALHEALRAVLARHEILRVRFGARDGVPFQAVTDIPPSVLEMVEVPGDDAARREAAALDDAHVQAGLPFDLAEGPLYRFRLYRIDEQDHLLTLVFHHIVCDGWSVGLLQDAIAEHYRAFAGAGAPAPSAEAPGRRPVQYRDAVAAQRGAAGETALKEHLAYWQAQLADLPVLELPTDRPRPVAFDPAGDVVRAHYGRELAEALRTAARRDGGSLSMLITAALSVVLGVHARESEVVLGTTALGRTDPEWESLVGLFVNAVVLKLDLSGDPSLSELLHRVRDTTLDAFEHQDAPFEQVVDRLRVPRDSSRNPLFQVLVQTLEKSTGAGGLDLPDAAVSLVEPPVTTARFDLVLTVADGEDGLGVALEYATTLFDRWRVEQLLAHLETVLRAAAGDGATRLSGLDLLSEQERARLAEITVGPHEPLRPVPLHTPVEEWAATAPDAPAVVFEGLEIGYGELWRRVRALAGYLRHDLGVGHEEVVAVALERGVEPVLAMLGVSKSGGAYVMLDVEHPVNRLQFILDDSATRIVLTTTALLDRLPEPGERTYVLLDADWPRIEAADARSADAAAPLEDVNTGDSLANVLYTSGTTGRPKGVLTEHRALMSYVIPFVRTYGLEPGDRILQFANLAFDLCQAEVYSALSSGATLICAPKDVLHTPERLTALLREQRVTTLASTPTMLSMIEPEPYPQLRNLFVGGEACPAEIANRWNIANRVFVNGYGPTEAAVGVTMHVVPRAVYRVSPPIGGPMPNRRLYVVDPESLAQLPVGVPGELLIGGDEGLARGYLNQPELTGQKFIPDPFSPGLRVYRTGDLVRWNPDGHLDFLGRIDSQVKLRGLRIELEEIETVLMTHPAVVEAAVALSEDPQGQKILAAYLTTAGGERPNPAELRRFVGEYVPVYMVPAAWTVLERMPRSSTGKLSRKALPRPEVSAFLDAARGVAALGTPAEHRIAAAIAAVLGLPASQIGADDDFFEIGGNSLQAMRVISRVNRDFATKLSVRALYGAPNLAEFARQVEAASGEAGAAGAQGPEAHSGSQDPDSRSDGQDGRSGQGGRDAATNSYSSADLSVNALTNSSADTAADLSAEAVAALFARVLPSGSGPAGPGDNLFGLGAAEDQGPALLELLERHSGIRLDWRDLFVPAVLAAALEARRAAEAWSPLVTLGGAAGRFAPLFCVPGANGSPSVFAGTARRLSSDRPVIGLERPGIAPGRSPLRTVEELAEHTAAAIRGLRPHGPYHLLGWSMGGLIAFETARILTEQGETVEFLALVDTTVPADIPEPDDLHLVGQFAEALAVQSGLPAPTLDALGPQVDLDTEAGLAAVCETLRGSVLSEDIGTDEALRQLAVYRASCRAAFAYRPSWRYPGRLDFLRAAGGNTGGGVTWAPFAEQAREYRLPGDHYSMWAAEHRPVLAAVLDALLGTIEPCDGDVQ